jgi:hypothetical protein
LSGANPTVGGLYAYYYAPSGMKSMSGGDGLCTHYPTDTTAWKGATAESARFGQANASIYFYSTIATIAEFKAYLVAQNTAGTPVTIIYPLATPIVTTIKNDLTLAQVSAIAEQGGTITVVGNDNSEYAKPDLSVILSVKYWEK